MGLPSGNQVLQSFLVAICSGVIATMLFFFALISFGIHQSN
ncbi:multidrug resistance efflux transporter family protein [Halalkalibacter alkalisediminis]